MDQKIENFSCNAFDLFFFKNHYLWWQESIRSILYSFFKRFKSFIQGLNHKLHFFKPNSNSLVANIYLKGLFQKLFVNGVFFCDAKKDNLRLQFS